MASERSKRRDLLALSFIAKSISKKLIRSVDLSVTGLSLEYSILIIRSFYFHQSSNSFDTLVIIITFLLTALLCSCTSGVTL